MTPDVLVAASQPASDSGGFLAFAVVAALFIAALILYRSLRRHLGKIDFEEHDPRAPDGTPPSGDAER